MKPISILNKLNESSIDQIEVKYNDVLNDFRSFIEAKYDTKSIEELKAQLQEVTEDDVNEFITDKFYDLEREDEVDELNNIEDAIRTVYPPQTSDESIFEPTSEDIEEMKYWYNDNPADLYAEKERGGND